jgi:hypothetical protein
VVADRGHQKDRQRGRRILDAEVPVGHLAVEHRVAVALVHGGVDDLVAGVEAGVEQGPGGAEDRQRDEANRKAVTGVSRWR